MEEMTVSCRCGSVKLKINHAQVAQFYCHCGDCRAVTGGAFTPVALFPADAVTVLGGNTFAWTYKTMPRTRCATCGTLLFGEPPGSGLRGVSAHLLPGEKFHPAFHIRCEHAVMPVKDDLPHFKDLPKDFGGSGELASW